MSQQDTERSYDDLPESDVVAVLQVPLLWGAQAGAERPAVGAHRRPSGRHRATDQGSTHHGGRRWAGRREPANRRTRSGTGSGWAHHPMAQTARVGLVAAGLVLALFAGMLLAMALWLP